MVESCGWVLVVAKKRKQSAVIFVFECFFWYPRNMNSEGFLHVFFVSKRFSLGTSKGKRLIGLGFGFCQDYSVKELAKIYKGAEVLMNCPSLGQGDLVAKRVPR